MSDTPASGRGGAAVRPEFDKLTLDSRTVRRLVLDLAWPSLMDNLLVTLVQMADMIQVGRVGADAIAAVGMSNQPIFFALAAFMALNVGATARGVVYMRIIGLSMPFATVSMNLSSVMRGAGDTKTPMRVNLVSNLINVVFNHLLINGVLGFPRWEVAGAAWATLLSRVVAAP